MPPPNNREVVVIGASAGGVEALRTFVAALPTDFRGSVFVILHIGNTESVLPSILTSAGVLPAIHPVDGQVVESGMIYVAPPDCHMLLSERDRIQLSHGPKENHTRPAINPLFRSAAATYGPAVTGIILSGNLDDGVLGLAEIKRQGGIAIVQDPKTAFYPSMPSSAIENVTVDYVVPVQDMPALVSSLTWKHKAEEEETAVEQIHSEWTCPECRGPLTEFRNGTLTEYRCRVGHAYSGLVLAQDHQDTVERKLWEAVVALEESAEIADRLGLRYGESFKQQARQRREQVSVVRDILGDMNAKFRAV